jgi:hypothetical protein
VIVPSLEKPTGARKLEEKDFGGYLMVYFKDETHSTTCGIFDARLMKPDLNVPNGDQTDP